LLAETAGYANVLQNGRYIDNVPRDAGFDTLGKLDAQPDGKLCTFAEGEKYIKRALRPAHTTCRR
jgi:hypothetical protein